MAGGVTNLGKKAIVGLTGNIDTQTAFTYIACGTGNTAFAATQTALVSEITDSGLARVSVTPTSETTTVTDDTLRLSKEFTVTGTKTIAEWGVFNASSAGVMLARDVPSSTTAVSNGSTLTWTFDTIIS